MNVDVTPITTSGGLIRDHCHGEPILAMTGMHPELTLVPLLRHYGSDHNHGIWEGLPRLNEETSKHIVAVMAGPIAGKFNRKDVETIQACESISHIDVSGTKLTRYLIKAISTLQSLVSADISHCTGHLSVLVDMLPQRLQALCLHGTRVRDDHLSSITHLDLGRLGLTRTLITGAGLDSISRIHTLRSLSISGKRIALDALSHLDPLQGLADLFLDGFSGDLPILALPNLGSMTIRKCTLSPGFMRRLPLHNLASLDLAGTKLAEADVKDLAKLTSAVALDLSDTDMTPSATGYLSPLRSLCHIALDGFGGADALVRSASFIPNISTASLDSTHLSNTAFRRLLRHSNLEFLSLANSNLADEPLLLSDLPNVRQLYLPSCPITTKGSRGLLRCQSLEALDLSETHVDDGVASVIKTLHSLRRLQLSDTNITDHCLRNIAQLGSIVELCLDRTNVTDKCITEMSKLDRLRSLSLVGSHVTHVGMARLQDALPYCSIIY